MLMHIQYNLIIIYPKGLTDLVPYTQSMLKPVANRYQPVNYTILEYLHMNFYIFTTETEKLQTSHFLGVCQAHKGFQVLRVLFSWIFFTERPDILYLSLQLGTTMLTSLD